MLELQRRGLARLSAYMKRKNAIKNAGPDCGTSTPSQGKGN